MQSAGREPSMEDILASIKKVIAEEKELRTSAAPRGCRRGRTASRRQRASTTTCSNSTSRSRRRSTSVRRWSMSMPPGRAASARAIADRRRDGAAASAGQPARGDHPRDASADAQAMARRAFAADGRRACEARDFADYRAPAVVFARGARLCYACGMIKTQLLLAAAAAALAASPLAARPMTATDLQSMHRLGAPDVSRDGHWAVFTLSNTDWDKNKRVNTLYAARSDEAGRSAAAGQGRGKGPRRGVRPGRIPVVPDAGRRHRPAVPHGRSAARRCRSAASRATSAASSSRRRATAVVVWADRDLRCADLDCAGLPAKAEDRLGPDLRPTVHSPLGHLGGAGRAARACSALPSPAASSPATESPLTGNLVGDTPSKPFGGGEEIAFSPDGRTVFSPCARPAGSRPMSTNLDIFAGAERRQRAAGQSDRRQ